MKCVVLCGATVPFTKLVKAIDRTTVEQLQKYGYDEIEVQYGLAREAFDDRGSGVKGFDFDPKLKSRVQNAQLVISHAGSGSILDALERGYGQASRKLVVVVNNDLMNNHQLELALKLEKEGCVVVCRDTNDLGAAIDSAMHRGFAKLLPASSLKPFMDKALTTA